jgi:hypothetical protein
MKKQKQKGMKHLQVSTQDQYNTPINNKNKPPTKPKPNSTKQNTQTRRSKQGLLHQLQNQQKAKKSKQISEAYNPQGPKTTHKISKE